MFVRINVCSNQCLVEWTPERVAGEDGVHLEVEVPREDDQKGDDEGRQDESETNLWVHFDFLI
jgi:hypothetical protein